MYYWATVYEDGHRRVQLDWQDPENEAKKNYYKDIDRDRLRRFEIWRDNTMLFWLSFRPGQKLIWRRRVSIAPGKGVEMACHILGKQEKVNGKNVQGIIVLYEDGRIEVSDRWRDDHPWLSPPVLREEERL